MDIQIKLDNGQILRGIIRSPGENIKAGVILVHGLGDHIRRYSHLASSFLKNDFGFTGVDLPGHGKSDGRRGNLNSFDLTDEMLDIIIKEHKKTFPGVPVFLYGHSLGGPIVLKYILQKKPAIKGAIVTSPWLRLSYEPNKFKKSVAGIMNKLIPSLIQPSGLNVSHISRNQEIIDAYKADPLVHNKISVGLFYSAVAAANYSLDHAEDLKIPLLLFHGSDDLITSPDGSREFASRTPMAELKIWEGGYHELHNEVFKEEVISFIEKWINTKLQG
jgi:acylglycerol lipase